MAKMTDICRFSRGLAPDMLHFPGELFAGADAMTKLYRNRLELMPRADNCLPRLSNPVAITEEQVPTISIGVRVFEPRLADLEARMPRDDAPREEQLAWHTEHHEASLSATYVSFQLNPLDALTLARNILRLVDDNGCIREPRSIGFLRQPNKESPSTSE
jgi:hypothetical protein